MNNRMLVERLVAKSTSVFRYAIRHLSSLVLACGFILLAGLPCSGQEKRVRLGIDQLAAEGFESVSVQNVGRVGLITNHTGLDGRGQRTVDLLQRAPNVKLTALFSPEHGLYGALDQSEIDHAIDPETGLRVWSLYGDTRKPTAKMLADVDTLVFEIQDVGTRFYTYIATMGHAMESAAEHGKRFVVLDRPNPIGGLKVDGPLADADDLSFVAYRELPVVHGMTIGELAVMFNEHWGIGCDLTVVRMRGWRRSMQWEDTGVTWVNPSPNMRSPDEARLYPAIGLLEFTNLSVGRGTPTPFEHFGAPWIEGGALASALNALRLKGVVFEPVRFKPDASKYKDEACGGAGVSITDFEAFEPTLAALGIMQTLKRMYPKHWDNERSNRLLRNKAMDAAWRKTNGLGSLKKAWTKSLDGFHRTRRDYLVYPE